MEIYIFARFHALEGKQGEATQALKEVLGPTRNEPGSIRIDAFRSMRGGRQFYIHSEWKDEEAFENYALPHTVRFRKRMETLDRPCVRGQPHGADRATARRQARFHR